MSQIGKVQYLKYYVRGNADDVLGTRSGAMSTLVDIRYMLTGFVLIVPERKLLHGPCSLQYQR